MVNSGFPFSVWVSLDVGNGVTFVGFDGSVQVKSCYYVELQNAVPLDS